MSLSKYVKILFVCLSFVVTAQAQFVNYGTDPASYKWNFVDLPHYQLIYPQGLDSMAYKYALYLENIYPHVQKSITKPWKKTFPVVLHPGTMHANGMVAWAPRRMELMTTPSSKIHAQSWDKHLVLHESRHVVQTSKLMTGLFKPLYFVLGEQAAGVSSFFSTRWFFEGDAVGAETALSNSGRGRLPEFNMTYRAQLFADTFYSFDKWYLGSYKDYTGDYYALGYDLTSFAKYRYGGDIWDKISSRYVSRFFHLPPFPQAIKYHTGDNVDGLFDKTFAFLKEEWEKLEEKGEAPVYLSPVVKQYTSYRYPQALNDSTLIAVKSDLSDLTSLVKIINGREERITYIGSVHGRIHLKKNRIYWSENVPGLRWTHANYLEVKYYDLLTGKIQTLTPRKRYLTLAVDSEGQQIAVSQFSFSGENQVILLDAKSGQELVQYPTPANAFIKELTWGEEDMLFAVAVNDKGLTLLSLHMPKGEWQELLPPTSVNITSPLWHKGELYFESGLNGTNNIYCMHLADRKIDRITSSRFGAFTPAVSADGKQLLFSDYQAKGYRIASVPVDTVVSEDSSFDKPYTFALAEAIAEQEKFNLDSAVLEPVAFAPKPYKKGMHTFKVHSWAPFYYDVSDVVNGGADDFSTMVKPGVMILSQNALNTAITQAGWYYKDNSHHGKLAFTYLGWYPVIDLAVDYGGKSFAMSWVKNEEGKEVIQAHYSRRKLIEAEARLYIPFNLSKDHFIRGVQPAVTYYFTNNRYQQFDSHKYRNFQYLLSELRFYNYRRMAHRDILPRWGYQLRLQYLHTPFHTENYGSLYTGKLTTYWPGLIRNHSLMVRLGYQYQAMDDKVLYIPKRLMDKTRGYDFLYQTRQQLTAKADYAFTVACPDVSIGSLLYVRRVRTNLFYDYTYNQAQKHSGWTTQSSVGMDCIFDWNVIRMSYPLSLGVRLIHPIDYGKFQTEILFSMDF